MKKEINKIKAAIWLLCLGVFLWQGATVANGQSISKKEQLESQKIAFITKQLDLTIEEAQQFWPVYNEYQQKNGEINKQRRKMRLKLDNGDNLSDNELEKLSDSYIALQLEEAKLANNYHEKFKAVLPIKKVIAYYRAEQKFKRFLLQQFQKNRGPKNHK